MGFSFFKRCLVEFEIKLVETAGFVRGLERETSLLKFIELHRLR